MLENRYRFIYMILVGILISFILKGSVYTEASEHSVIYDFLVAIIITICVWEGNLWIDRWMNQRYPWITHTTTRILVHLPIALVYTSVTLYSLLYVHTTLICGNDTEHKKLMVISLLISLLISVILLSVEIGGQLLKGWKNSLVEVERYKTESVAAQLQNLKDQLNPHFLFNNLSVLSSLVYKDQDKAVDFINQLSKVYRYLIDNQFNELVSLKQEFSFIQSYIYLLQIRFSDHIVFDIDLDEGLMQHRMPPMALQMVLENAVKHNEISTAFPLIIHIRTAGDTLEISNPVRLRTFVEPGSGTGHRNIQERYRYFSDRQMEIIQQNQQYLVRLPLLPST